MVTREFVTAGKATLTCDNGRGNWYTYKVRHKKANDRYPEMWQVLVLTGPDNTKHYTYLGKLIPDTGEIRLTAGSKLPEDAVPVRVIRWAMAIIYGNGQLPAGYEIHHEGRCGCCNRPLTTPESVASGIGPKCAGRIAVGPNRKAV